MLTLIADGNIANLDDCFNEQVLGVPVNLIKMAGRDITAKVIKTHQPDGLLIRSVTTVNAALLDNNDRVRFVGSATIGTDHVDQDYLAESGIRFTNAAGSSKHSVAQYVMTAILTLLPQYWTQSPKLGIIGLGNIGSTLAQYATDLGWDVLGYDPFKDASRLNNRNLDDLLEQSDVISLHVPLTTAEQSDYPTHHLIDSKAFEKMHIDTVLINTARGAVVSEVALLQDLSSFHEPQSTQNSTQQDSTQQNSTHGFANKREVVLDVFEHEPTVSAQLLEALTIATPHIAGYSLEGKLRGTQMVFNDFVRTFKDELKVTQTELMSGLLPDNPYQWKDLIANPTKLPNFYDIMTDDQLLTKAMMTELKTGRQSVQGTTFDALRKHYALRREWLFDK